MPVRLIAIGQVVYQNLGYKSAFLLCHVFVHAIYHLSLVRYLTMSLLGGILLHSGQKFVRLVLHCPRQLVVDSS